MQEITDLLMFILAFAGVFFMGFVVGGARASRTFDEKIKQFLVGLDTSLSRMMKDFGDNVGRLQNGVRRVRKEDLSELEKSIATEPPSPEIMEKMDTVAQLSQEIAEMAMSLEGPLRGSLDAKHRRSVAAQLKEKQEEVQTIMREVVAAGFNPKVMMIDQHGNRSVKHLSDIIKTITDGPEQMTPFADDDSPNLGIVTDDDEPVKH